MKIIYDHQCYWERFGGVSKYFTEIIKRIPKEQYILPVKLTNNEYIHQIQGINTHTFFRDINFRGKATLIKELGKLYSIVPILKGNYDIYHPTHYDCYGLDLIPKRVRTIATIHDMNYYVIPDLYGKGSRLANWQKKMAEKVDHIITISQSSKKDLINIWNIPESKISVIYHGVNAEMISKVPKIEIKEKYILYVGRRSKYKNFSLLINAFAKLSLKHKNLYLFCAGEKWSKEEIRELNNLKIIDKCRSFQATDNELINLYKNAVAFVFPSFYEGFGLPILEAMAAECPMILSNTSCFPEIAKNAALYFNPNSLDELIDNIELLINDYSERNNLILRGKSIVRDYSWKKSVQQHLEVYKSIL